jgi:all-beta uncharacterized protein/BACON domain-containing protein
MAHSSVRASHALLRASLLVAAVAAAASALGCGASGTTTITAPATVSKCAVSVVAPDTPLAASGGTGNITVTTTRECAWTAASENGWLSIKEGASGQGDGTVRFEAAANPDPATRRGAIVLNNQRAEITQAAGVCTITLGEDAASFDTAGGSGRIDVRASSALCTWTAATDADWISIRSGAAGKGTGVVAFDVAATSGPPRAGGITVGGQRYTVTQSQGCSYTFNPTAYQVGPEGGTGTVTVATTGGCPWTATSNVDWITITSGAGTVMGPGTATFTVAPATGPTRSAALTIAGHPFTVTQAQGCTYALAPDSASVPAAGGTVPITVTTGASCGWTAASNVPWIVIASGAQESGPGTVQLTVAATTGPNRSGTATIAGRTFAVNQGQGCTFTISRDSASIDAAGGSGAFDVHADSGCAWSANESADWITIVSGNSGSGDGTVKFTAAANSGAARTATISVGGRTFAVSQGAGCSYSLTATSTSVPGEGGSGTVGVTTSAACTWTAASNADWLTITGGSRGTGNGTVSFTAAARTGSARSGTLTVAGRTFTVNQSESCTYSVSPTEQNAAADGGTVTVTVKAAGGCRWTATSNVPWISVPPGAGANGDGTVALTIAANTGSARTGTVSVAGHTVTINQGATCSYSLSPTSQQAPAGGGPGSVSVTAPAGCSWTAAVTSTPWVSITAGASGSGNGTVQYTIQPNAGATRTGTLTIAGQSFTITQGVGCSFAIAPTGQTVPAGGGNVNVNVTGPGGCSWTVDNPPAWAHVTSGAPGDGSGTVQMAVDPNTGGGRNATFTIAGQPFALTQDGVCTYSVAPDTLARGSAAANGSVDVTAAAGCSWTAASNAPEWLTISGGASGTGNGHVDFAIAANPGPARTGTLVVATHTVTVNQDPGCTYALSAPGLTAPAIGALGSVNVTAAAGCPWTAVSQTGWILLQPNAGGSGDGTLPFGVEPNLTGAPRTGTILVAGQTFTVTQQQ